MKLESDAARGLKRLRGQSHQHVVTECGPSLVGSHTIMVNTATKTAWRAGVFLGISNTGLQSSRYSRSESGKHQIARPSETTGQSECQSRPVRHSDHVRAPDLNCGWPWSACCESRGSCPRTRCHSTSANSMLGELAPSPPRIQCKPVRVFELTMILEPLASGWTDYAPLFDRGIRSPTSYRLSCDTAALERGERTLLSRRWPAENHSPFAFIGVLRYPTITFQC